MLDAIRSDLLPPEFQDRLATEIARFWDGWVTARDVQIRRRLERGDDDSVINLLLFGSSFTREPRATAREILTLASQGRLAELIQSPLGQRLIQTWSPAPRRPARTSGSSSSRASWPSGRSIRSAISRSGSTACPLRIRRVCAGVWLEQSVRFDDCGLSSDTSIYPGFAIEQALEAVASARLIGAGTVRRLAVVGPGLDFTDKREGHDFYPQQTLQPFALIDSLMRLGLANDGGVSVTTFDLSQRVNDHLDDGPRARAGRRRLRAAPSAKHDFPAGTLNLTVYWRRFGDRIGVPVAPMPTPAGVDNIDVRAVRVSAAMALRIVPHDLNIVLQRLEPLTDEERFDLSSPPTCWCTTTFSSARSHSPTWRTCCGPEVSSSRTTARPSCWRPQWIQSATARRSSAVN